MNFVKDF
jgi:hypothetical protein